MSNNRVYTLCVFICLTSLLISCGYTRLVDETSIQSSQQVQKIYLKDATRAEMSQFTDFCDNNKSSLCVDICNASPGNGNNNGGGDGNIDNTKEMSLRVASISRHLKSNSEDYLGDCIEDDLSSNDDDRQCNGSCDDDDNQSDNNNDNDLIAGGDEECPEEEMDDFFGDNPFGGDHDEELEEVESETPNWCTEVANRDGNCDGICDETGEVLL